MLVISLLALLSASILVMAVFGVTRAIVKESVFQKRMAQGRAIAEAGFEDAMLQLRLNPNWRTGFTNKAFAGGSYTVILTTGTPSVITSVGTAQALMLLGAASATLRAQSQVQLSTGTCTTYSAGNTTMASSINAYDSSVSVSPSSYMFGGHYCSNGTFNVTTVAGTISVRMNVNYFTAPAPTASTVEGVITKSTVVYTLPTFDGSAYVASNSNGSLPIAYYTAGTKAFSVPYGSTATIMAGTYYLNTLTVNGQINVNTSTGPVVIYLNNNLTLTTTAGSKTGNINNLSKVPNKLVIYPQGARTLTLSSAYPLYGLLEGGPRTSRSVPPKFCTEISLEKPWH